MHRRPYVSSLLRVTAVAALFILALAPVVVASTAMTARLSGAEEVPVNNSLARGTTVFRLSDDGSELHYRLNVANLHDVTQAHIHLAPAGANGPVVAWLYPSGPPAQLIPGRTSGTLATGTITSASLVGPLAGGSVADLMDAIRDGNTYVNVHTSQFPPGEIRGQIDTHGHH
jgi:hypothetical protein